MGKNAGGGEISPPPELFAGNPRLWFQGTWYQTIRTGRLAVLKALPL
jgi:hypothetical protein